MVEAEKSMFGDIFSAELVPETEEYKIGEESEQPVSIKIDALDSNAGMQVDCTSRVIWKASVALSHWFNKPDNVKHL